MLERSVRGDRKEGANHDMMFQRDLKEQGSHFTFHKVFILGIYTFLLLKKVFFNMFDAL